MAETTVKPMKFAVFLSRHPELSMLLCFLLMMAMTAIGMPNFQVNTKPPNGRSAYAVNDDYRTQRLDAWIMAQKDVKAVDVEQAIQTDAMTAQGLIVMLQTSDKSNVLTPLRLDAISKLDKALRGVASYSDTCHMCPENQTQFVIGADGNQKAVGGCVPCLGPNTRASGCGQARQCSAPQAVTNFLYPEVESWSSTASSATPSTVFNGLGSSALTQANLDTTLSMLSSAPMKPLRSFLMDKTFSETNLKAHTTRLLYKFGMPLKGYSDAEDRQLEQFAIIGKAQVEMKKVIDDMQTQLEENHGIEVLFFGNPSIMEELVNETLVKDASFAFGSAVFVFLFMCSHTGSVFLAGFGMVHIILSLPVAIFWTSVVCGIQYFDMLNMFVLFVILGIGADNVFVVSDAWNQSSRLPSAISDNLELRMSYVLRRSAKATLVTSLTTTLAFLANAFSTLMPTSAFGIFSAFVIACNYVLVISWFPAVLLVHHKYIIVGGVCRRNSEKAEVSEATKGPSKSSKAEGLGESEHMKAPGRVEKFMLDAVLPMILKWKRSLAVSMTMLAIVFTILGAQLEKDKEEPKMFPDGHMMVKFLESSQDDFASSDEDPLVRVDWVFGLESEVDRTGFTKYDFASKDCDEGPCGTYVLDSTFQLETPEQQQAALELCTIAEDAQPACYRGDRKPSCLMADFKAFREGQNASFPVVQESFGDAMEAFLYGVPETMIRYVLSKSVAWDEGAKKFRYYSVSHNVNFNPDRFYIRSTTGGCEDSMNSLLDTAALPEGLSKGYTTTAPTQGFFVKVNTAEQFSGNAVSGLIISMSLAFVVLNASTQNWRTAFVAFMCIGFVVFCTMGVFYVVGWKLGVVESICLSLVVGFSVDYIVHFANSYSEAPAKAQDRVARVKHAVHEMGVSVLGGGLTTMGASLFLFGTTLQFFFKFGVFMMFTIGFSLLFSNFLFLPLQTILGPQGNEGRLGRGRGKETEEQEPQDSASDCEEGSVGSEGSDGDSKPTQSLELTGVAEAPAEV